MAAAYDHGGGITTCNFPLNSWNWCRARKHLQAFATTCPSHRMASAGKNSSPNFTYTLWAKFAKFCMHHNMCGGGGGGHIWYICHQPTHTYKCHVRAAVSAAYQAFGPNQTSQGQIHTLDVGSKHLTGIKYTGWWLLHRLHWYCTNAISFHHTPLYDNTHLAMPPPPHGGQPCQIPPYILSLGLNIGIKAFGWHVTTCHDMV